MKPIKDIGYWQHRLEYIVISIALTIVVVIVVGALLRLILHLISWRKLLSRNMVSLELTPPAFTSRTAYSTEELFKVIAGLRNSRSLRDKLLLRQITIPYEVVSTEGDGIRFITHVDNHYAASVAQNIMTYLPEIKVAEVSKDALAIPDHAQVIEFKQTGEWFLPFAKHINLEQHDPMAYIAGVMTKLKDKDIMGIQIIVTPAKIRNAGIIAYKALRNEDVIFNGSHKKSILPKITHAINVIMFGILDLVGEAYHGSSSHSSSNAQRNAYEQIQIAKGLKPARTLSKLEQQRNEAIHEKVSQQLFHVTIRVMVAMDTPEATNARLAAIKSSLASYSVPSYQGLKPRLPLPFIDRYRQFTYRNGLPALLKKHSCILSSSEIASLYHFPIGTNAKVDNLNASLSRTLPAPISLKQRNVLDVVIGSNSHHGVETDIGLTPEERERHIYIIGGTGNGKTTMLQYAIVQDMQNGKGLAIVDPHGDMSETMLKHVPPERVKDVIYFNPDDLEYPIGLNLLELTPGLSGNELLREKDIITESVVSVFRKIFSEDDSGGHRIEYVLRNTIHTALTVEGATLFTVLKILQNATYRKSITDKLKDQDLKDFWKNELGQAGNMQRVKMSAGITAKIGRFNANAAAKLILGQKQSTIDFEDIINSGKILICNFSKGLLGEDVSELFGVTTLAKLQLASLRRARLAQSERRAFQLYVDEFQNFATPSFVQMLSESRKYRLFMTMAEQSTSQQKDQQMIDVILANVGTVICFRTGNPQDERLLLPLFSPYIKPGEIANLSSFNFYAKLSAIHSQEPLSGQTLLLPDNGDEAVAKVVIAYSREHYTGKPEETPATPVVEKSGKPKSNKKGQTSKAKKVRMPGQPANSHA